MRRSFLVLLALFFIGARCASAQQILPPSFGPWITATPVSAPAAASSVLSEMPPAILSEYGLISSESAGYSLAGQGASQGLQATLFRLKDPTAGYGLYSYLQTPGMAPAGWSDHALVSQERALVLLGNIVLDIRGRNLSEAGLQLKILVDAVRPSAESGPLPTLAQLLPSKGAIAGTDRYILGPQALNQLFPAALGDSLGLSAGTEAELARYRVGGREAVLLVADFPTPQLAAQAFADLQQKFDVNGSKRGAGPPLYAKRALTLLAIVSGPSNKAEAATLLNQVRSATELTWNEPTFRFKEPRIEVMILGTILGTVFICALMVIASLTFGGLRLLVKRALPNRVFDRTSQLQILQLGLSSKPINAEDFYSLGGPSGPEVKVDKNLPDRIALRIFR